MAPTSARTPGAEARQLTVQGQERKQQLLDHAARLFADRGFGETRIIDICRSAGVAKGLFYWYFENKEQLFRELSTDIHRRLRIEQAAVLRPTDDPLTRLARGVEASVRFMADNAPFFALLEAENGDARFSADLRAGTEVHVRDVVTLVQQGIDAGQIVDDDPVLLARGVVGIVGIYSHFHRTGRTSLPVDELSRFVSGLVLRSLAAEP